MSHVSHTLWHMLWHMYHSVCTPDEGKAVTLMSHVMSHVTGRMQAQNATATKGLGLRV